MENNKNKLKICALFTCSSVLFSECLVISLRIALISGGMHIKEKKFTKRCMSFTLKFQEKNKHTRKQYIIHYMFFVTLLCSRHSNKQRFYSEEKYNQVFRKKKISYNS